MLILSFLSACGPSFELKSYPQFTTLNSQVKWLSKEDYKELKAHYHTWHKQTLLNIVNLIYGAKMMLFSLSFDFIFNYMCIYCTILYLYLTLPKGPCEILSSVGVCRPQLPFSSSSLKLLGQIGTKFYWNDPWMVPFQNYIGHADEPSNKVAIAKNRKKETKFQQSSPLKLLGRIEQNFS